MSLKEILENKIDLIDNILIEMASDGLILCKCPKCKIPMDKNELLISTCNKCGSVDFESIIFIHNEQTKNNLS